MDRIIQSRFHLHKVDTAIVFLLSQLNLFWQAENVLCRRDYLLKNMRAALFKREEPAYKVTTGLVQTWTLVVGKRRSSKKSRTGVKEPPLAHKLSHLPAGEGLIDRGRREGASGWLREGKLHLLVDLGPPPTGPAVRLQQLRRRAVFVTKRVEPLFEAVLQILSFHPYRPLEPFVVLAEPCFKGNEVSFGSLPSELDHSAAHSYCLLEVSLLYSLSEKAQRVKDVALAGGIGPNQNVQRLKRKVHLAQAAIIFNP
jgi:hypothetical protein